MFENQLRLVHVGEVLGCQYDQECNLYLLQISQQFCQGRVVKTLSIIMNDIFINFKGGRQRNLDRISKGYSFFRINWKTS